MTPEDLRRAAELWDERAKICAPQSDKKAEAERLAAGLRAMADAEPVAWVYWLPSQDLFDGPNTIHKKSVSFFTEDTRHVYLRDGWQFEPLYTAPQRPQWVGLTNEEIDKAQIEGEALFKRSKYGARGQQLMPSDSPDWWFARAIESALRAKNGGAA